MAGPRSVDVNTFVDDLKLNRFHILILALCTTLMMIDGYELYVVGWVLPDLANDFGVSRTDLTPILVAQQIGMVLGAYFITPLADRFGRPKLLLIAFSVIALSCVAILFAPNIPTFMACRLVAGMFASAVVPILLSIVTENAPKRYRATFGTIVVSGALAGALIGAAMQAFLLEPYGWRAGFWLGVLLPVIMLPVMAFYLTDTLRYLVARRPGDPRIPLIVRRMNRGGEDIVVQAPAAPANADQGRAAGNPGFVQGLFGEGRMISTIFIWLAFMSSFIYISAGTWKTTIFLDVVGMDWRQVGLATAIGTATSIVGNILIGMAIDRWGFRKVVPAAFFLAAISVAAMGFTVSMMVPFFIFLAIMNAFQSGGQAGLATLASNLYPSAQRATGVGWAYGAGRTASIVAPILGARSPSASNCRRSTCSCCSQFRSPARGFACCCCSL
ncbi:MAG: MFS transporter [Terricaulis sp.]|nr:MFS transporter [Terricaulis sp.]